MMGLHSKARKADILMPTKISALKAMAVAASLVIICSCAEDFAVEQEHGDFRIAWEQLPDSRAASTFSTNRHFTGPGGTIFLMNQWGREPDGTGSVIISRDKGISWETGGKGLNYREETRDMEFFEDGTILAGVYVGGVFRSGDGGRSWQQVNNHLADISVRSLVADSEGTVFVATGSGNIFRSFDRGGLWERCTSDSLPVDLIGLEIDRGRDLIYGISYEDGLYCFSDDCSAWHRIPYPEYFRPRRAGMDSEGFLYMTSLREILIHNPEEGWYFDLSGLLGSDYISDIFLDSTDRVYVKTFNGRWLASYDRGGSWQDIEWTFGDHILVNDLFEAEGCIYISNAYSNRGLYRSCDDGLTWEMVGNQSVWLPEPLVLASGEVFCHQIYSVVAYKPGDPLWTLSGAFDIDCEFYFNNPEGVMAEHPDGYLLAAFCGIYRSYDGGGSWEEVVGADTVVSSIEIDSGGMVYLATNHGLLRSGDGLSTFDVVLPGEQDPYAVEALEDGLVLVGDDGGLMRSLDHGDSWETLIDTSYVNTIAVDDEGNVYIGMDDKVLFSGNRGDDWQKTIFDGYMESPKTLLMTGCGKVLAHTNYRRVSCLESGEIRWQLVTSSMPSQADISVGADGYLYYFTDTLFRSCVPVREFLP